MTCLKLVSYNQPGIDAKMFQTMLQTPLQSKVRSMRERKLKLSSFTGSHLLLGFAAAVSILFPLKPATAQSPPEPPAGYRWEVNESFTDEFDGDQLDGDKWHDHNPRWKGRPPGLFMPSSVSVKDGSLQIKCTKLNRPKNEFNIACGAVQSKAKTALYGYYECRMKASSLSTSSTFWLAGGVKKVDGGTIGLELDIHESMGGAEKYPAFALNMNCNTHQHFRPAKKSDGKGDSSGKVPDVKKGGRIKLSSRVNDEFHTYGCWWVDANTMKFYADGKPGLTIDVPTDLDPEPFDQPMFMNLVCETYKWVDPPKNKDLRDDTRNTTHYDYVRAWKLVKVDL
jgi:beta-glucanase (GH16 family)